MLKFGRILCAAALIAAPIANAHEADELPVGDGHVTNHPAVGNVFACNRDFRGDAPGAFRTGAWFHGATWNPLQKPHVQGKVMWPQASLQVTEQANALSVKGNGLPVSQPTGTFPVAPTDPAFAYDRNPNRIQPQTLAFEIPRSPVKAEPGCLSMGMIGFTLTGVAFYNALDAGGRDAAAHEIQDLCDGHPQMSGQYHYHSSSPCLPGADKNQLVGWALDGFPIFGMRDKAGKLLTNADLDACHGRAEPVSAGGRTYAYAYRLTREYPYTLGCYVGQILPATRQALRPMGPLPRGPR